MRDFEPCADFGGGGGFFFKSVWAGLNWRGGGGGLFEDEVFCVCGGGGGGLCFEDNFGGIIGNFTDSGGGGGRDGGGGKHFCFQFSFALLEIALPFVSLLCGGVRGFDWQARPEC